MRWGFYGQCSVVVIASLCILAVIVKRAREYGVKPLNVEQEQVRDRAIIATIGQHHPTIDVDDCADDPIASFVERMELDRRVNALR